MPHALTSGSAKRGSRRALRALLTMTEAFDGPKNVVILRRPRSGRLEGRTALIQLARFEER